MHTDAAFIVGHAHHDKAQPCQDYALSGSTGSRAWAVVADGCSTGGRTDLGARLWAHAAQALLTSEASEAAVQSLDAFASALRMHQAACLPGLVPADLLATLLVADVRNGRLRVLAFGDGCVVLRHKDGRVHAIEMSYENNGPRYLAYRLTPGLDDAWQQQMAGSNRTARHWHFDANGHLENVVDDVCPADTGSGWFFDLELAEDPLDLAVIASDGAVSLDSRAAGDWFLPLAAVKSCAGQFVQRRLSAMVRGWQRQGVKGPADDLAVSGIWLKEEPIHG